MSLRYFLKGLPAHGWVGVGLIAISWTLNWSLTGLRTHLLFFPLWLGYCLFIDALVLLRKGTSMLTRHRRAYVMLFLISVPGWWLFELINWRTQNWFYIGRQLFTDLEYFMCASICFSTVMPAVFGTAELVSTLGWIRRIRPGLVVTPRRATLLSLFAMGWVMLGLLLMWPRFFFPLVWLSTYLILDPLNFWLKNRSLLDDLAVGNWRPMLALGVGCLICGFFWEMWNFYSYPKWCYQVPFVDFFHVFEMPILGYGGYIPFSLELFALYHLVAGVVKRGEPEGFVRISSD